jgi:hypothetical protein
MTVDLTGDYQTTIYDTASRLLADGADPGVTVESYRDGKLSMSGVIGERAKWQVVFRARGPTYLSCFWRNDAGWGKSRGPRGEKAHQFQRRN